MLSSLYPTCALASQVSTTAQEEKLGVDFGDLFAERQLAGVQADVAAAMSPADGAKAISFDSTYATGRFTQYRELLSRYIKVFVYSCSSPPARLRACFPAASRLSTLVQPACWHSCLPFVFR